MSDITVDAKIKIDGDILDKRGLRDGGKVQKLIDKMVLDRCERYIPKDTGRLIQSGYDNTKIGSGKVVWGAPYAVSLYYNNNTSNGIRGKKWFERMKIDFSKDIVAAANRLAGGTN